MTEIDLIGQMLERCSGYIRDSYDHRGNIEVNAKLDENDLVTTVDVTVQRIIVATIREAFPHDDIIGEESGFNNYNQEAVPRRCWLIDPIDGTQNFVRGFYPTFGVSIGFVQEGVPACGGILLPITGDCFMTERGSGATRNGNRVSVSPVESVRLARIDVDFGNQSDRDASIKVAGPLIRATGQIRSYASAVVGFCQVAAGEQDAYVTLAAKPWDVAAGQVLVEEAAGRVSDMGGNTSSPFSLNNGIVVSNGRIHDECLSWLGGRDGLGLGKMERRI